MTLTVESLTATLEQLAGMIEDTERRMVLRPTHLIVSPAMLNRLLYRPPIAKRRGVRGRRMALKQRARPALWGMGL